jgi:hypothetical protein
MTKTIFAHRTATPDQAWAAARQIVMAAGAWAIGKGWLQADTAGALGTLALIVAPFVIGQLKTRLRAQQLAAVASSPKVPDSIASIKE